MRFSVYIVCPSVLNCSNLQLHQTSEVKNIFKQEKIMLQLTFNPGLMLTGFPTTRPWWKPLQMFWNCLSRQCWDHYSCFCLFVLLLLFSFCSRFCSFVFHLRIQKKRSGRWWREVKCDIYKVNSEMSLLCETCKLDSKLSMIYNWSIEWGKLMFSVIQAGSASY